MPWTARKILRNPGYLCEKLDQIYLEAFDNPEDEFGKHLSTFLREATLRLT